MNVGQTPQTGAPTIGHPSSPFLLNEEAALYLRFELKDEAGHRTGMPDTEEFAKWVKRSGVRKLKRGRRVMFHIDDLDTAIGFERSRLRKAS